ncbi:hypothetical protein MBLNU457_g2685t1 [Dothideomycetes sp. NU457]
MFRSASRSALHSARSRVLPSTSIPRRFVSTAPADRPRSWKGSAVRWGLAGALVYYYNTSSVFADESAYAIHAPPETRVESETLPTLDQIAAERRSKKPAPAPAPTTETVATSADVAAPGSPNELEEEAEQQGAFNEETGEINWDCPCLGGMAHGPCGEDFRAAFSCFVYSKEEPKGVDCIDKFKNMQDCFRQHPDVYGAELDDDEETAATGEPAPALADESSPGLSASPAGVEPSAAHASAPPAQSNMHTAADKGEKVSDRRDDPASIQGKQERSQAATQQVKSQHDITSESDQMVPKAAHDATGETSKGSK